MAVILLTNDGEALVDDADIPLIDGYNWHRNSNGYARTSPFIDGRTVTLYMHRLITAAPRGKDVDHINGDRLNNSRSNLRVCNRSRNAANQRTVRGRSRYRGVSFHKRTKRWHAAMKVDGRRVFIGSFGSEVEAARAYNDAAVLHHGSCANLNDLDCAPKETG